MKNDKIKVIGGFFVGLVDGRECGIRVDYPYIVLLFSTRKFFAVRISVYPESKPFLKFKIHALFPTDFECNNSD